MQVRLTNDGSDLLKPTRTAPIMPAAISVGHGRDASHTTATTRRSVGGGSQTPRLVSSFVSSCILMSRQLRSVVSEQTTHSKFLYTTSSKHGPKRNAVIMQGEDLEMEKEDEKTLGKIEIGMAEKS